MKTFEHPSRLDPPDKPKDEEWTSEDERAAAMEALGIEDEADFDEAYADFLED
jgi:hypothetical protein